MKWTKNPPDKAGWWWTRYPLRQYEKVRRLHTGILRIVRAKGKLCVQTDVKGWTRPLELYLETEGREWAGPIPMPKEDDGP